MSVEPPNPDTNVTELTVHISTSGVKFSARPVLGERTGVLVKEVSSFQGTVSGVVLHLLCYVFIIPKLFPYPFISVY